jgi:hypothetical protein
VLTGTGPIKLGLEGSLFVARATTARMPMEAQMPTTTAVVILIEDMPFIRHAPTKVYIAIIWTRYIKMNEFKATSEAHERGKCDACGSKYFDES